MTPEQQQIEIIQALLRTLQDRMDKLEKKISDLRKFIREVKDDRP